MKKIIFLFLIFSGIVFAEWEVGTDYTTDGDTITTFITYDYINEAMIGIGVNVDGTGFSVITIEHYQIEKGDNSIVLIVTDNDGSDITCRFHEEDIKDYYINIISGRSSVLTKILYNGKSAILKKRYTDETLATFDLRGIKQIMEKHVGSSYWYKYKLND